ncbi:MAG TPA: nitroreductase family deazaflavin-dependent oxidoreductase [Candidatus Binataceae bacterium]|nr:nitroreductase family deazaflavin-dependent oxidoreductase [Candidatus Binataceae bacterium]
MRDEVTFLKPSSVERLFNQGFALLLRLGIGLRHNYILEVRGRKSGRIYSAPVDVLDYGGRRYLVCGRGLSQWVRNAQAAGRVALVKGSQRIDFAVRAIPDAEKPAIIKAYVEGFKLTVQRYFPVAAGSPVADFEPIANRYPVFELIATA